MSSKIFNVTKKDVISFELRTYLFIILHKDSLPEKPSSGDLISIDGKEIMISQLPFIQGNFIHVPVKVSCLMNFI